MSMAKGTSKRMATRSAKEPSRSTCEIQTRATKVSPKKMAVRELRISTELADVVKVRENIKNMVWNAAETIATQVIAAANEGQLAAVKYLFEVVGMYPATEETKGTPEEDSLAYILLKRLGLPTEPVTFINDSASGMLASRAGTNSREVAKGTEG
ncbi:MAG: hypothetical protein JWQ87_3325 [Candidatus Sulfotelmatobacter sp.]|nr:hypothetical protein [Candidatus Sulfotelmatobacter sp.]